MTVTIYHNPKCSKSRATLELLNEHAQDINIVDYLNTPPSVAELTNILKMLDTTAGDFMRPKEAKEAGIDADSLNEAQLIEKLVENPRAIERPIVIANGKAAIGRPPESVLDIL